MSLISLFKAFTENKIILAEKLPSNNNPTDRIMAQVKALQDIYALLNSQEKGDFWARVNSPVKVGEYLLLQFIKIQDGKPYYRILKRFAGRLKLNEGKIISYLRLFIEGQEALIPVILRDFSDSEEEIGRNGKKPATTVCNWRMDFVVKTSNLGLIIIQFMKRDNIYYSQLLVESEKTGHALESELGELRTLTKDLKERNVILLKWGLLPDRLKEEIAHLLQERGTRLDTQV